MTQLIILLCIIIGHYIVQGSQFSHLQGGTFTPSQIFGGLFSPHVSELRGYHCMFKGAKLSQGFGCNKILFLVQYLDYKCNVHSFLQSKNKQKTVILMLMQVCFLLHGHKCFGHKWKELTLFQADTQNKALEGEHTPLQQIQRVNSTHRTDLKGVKIGSSASKTPTVCFNGSPGRNTKLNSGTVSLRAHLHVVGMMRFMFLTQTDPACPLLCILFLCPFLP